MKKIAILSAVLFVSAGFFAGMVQDGFAATYKFVDKNGQVGFADDLQAVPEPYRATAVLIGGGGSEGERTSGSPAATGAQAPAQPGMNAQQAPPEAVPDQASPVQTQPLAQGSGLPFSIRLAISIGVVIATILISVFLGNVAGLHGHDRAIHVLRVSLSWLVVIYLVAAHAQDVMAIFKTVGKQVQSVSDQSAKRGEKAAKAIKAMDALREQAEKQAQEHDKAIKEAEQEAEK